ncbi:hypothetical protein SPD48_18640 [Pseudogracilibacillus sp. SE30717A]|uniref:Ig-like domain-containing protein n=1 Tax=Pseudogracilibacillus sp. SE30717A TaxID=3098293 RepID=UPI00300DFC72
MRKRITISLLALLSLSVIFYFLYTYISDQRTTHANKSENDKEETVMIDEEDYLSMKTNVPIDQILELEFGGELDTSTVSEENFSVIDENDNIVKTDFSLTNHNKTVRISPPKGNYEKDSTYRIVFNDQIRYTNGDSPSKGYEQAFYTVRDEVEEAILNPDLIIIENNEIKKIDEVKVTIDKIKDKPIKEEDILILLTDDPDSPDGQAIKVSSIKSKWNAYEIEYEEPYFEELYENMDVYKVYPIEESDIILPETEGDISITTAQRATTDTNLASTSVKTKFTNDVELKVVSTNKDGQPTIKFSLKNYKIKLEDLSLDLSGNISLIDPNVIFEAKINLFTLDRFQLIHQIEIDSDVKATLKNSKDSDQHEKKFKKKVPFAKVAIPTAVPGLMVEGMFFLNIEYNQNAEVSVEVDMQYMDVRGIIYEDNITSFINDTELDVHPKLSGNAKVEAKGGIGGEVGVSAFKVLAAKVELLGGYKLEGEVASGFSDKINDSYACFSYEEAVFADGSILFEPKVSKKNKLMKKLKVKHQFLEQTFPKESYNNCDQFFGFKVDEMPIKLQGGENYNASLLAESIDLLTMKTNEEKLKETDFSIELSKEDVVEVSFDEKESILQVKAYDEPADKEVIIHLENKDTILDIPVTITNYDAIQEQIAKREEEEKQRANAANGLKEKYMQKARAIEDKIQRDAEDPNFTVRDGFLGQYYEDWDDLLNEVWGVLRDTMPSDEFEKLKAEQIEWNNNKEHTFENYGDYSHASERGRGMDYLSDVTADRVFFLIVNYMN